MQCFCELRYEVVSPFTLGQDYSSDALRGIAGWKLGKAPKKLELGVESILLIPNTTKFTERQIIVSFYAD